MGDQGACDTTKPAVLQYQLSAYDWKVIKILIKLLKPFEVAANQLQGSGVPGARSTCGSFDEYFPDFEILLDHLESAIEGTIFEEVEDPVTKEKKGVEVAIYDGLDNRTRRLLKVFIKLGWKKLHKYYNRLTSAVYVGAVVFNPARSETAASYALAILNPASRWGYFENMWTDRAQLPWLQEAKTMVRKLWEEEYKSLPTLLMPDEEPPLKRLKVLSALERHRAHRTLGAADQNFLF